MRRHRSDTAAHLRLGAQGEHLAARWYRRRGYRIIDRNWQGAAGEIDLVVTRGATLVFCEVKTRTSRYFGHPAEAVTPAKQRRLRRLASDWLATRRSRRRSLGFRLSGSDRLRFDTVQFDIAAVEGRRVQVIHDAF